MSQRSYANDRNRKDGKPGSTRKSAAQAKPVRKQGTIETSSPATKSKKKKADPNKDWAGLPTSPEIKKWRRVWWVLLGGALVLAFGNLLIPGLRTNQPVLTVTTFLVFTMSMAAVIIDLTVIRKLRNALIKQSASKKSSKHDAPKNAVQAAGKKDAS